jgi:hypothetical protein
LNAGKPRDAADRAFVDGGQGRDLSNEARFASKPPRYAQGAASVSGPEAALRRP